MRIRAYTDKDLAAAMRIHRENALDEKCFPNLTFRDREGKEVPNPLFVVKAVLEIDEKPMMMCFLKLTSELYFLVDHEVGTPEERWERLKTFKEYMKQCALALGLEQMTAFVPEEIEKSFAPRLLELGFIKSPWQSYTLNLED